MKKKGMSTIRKENTRNRILSVIREKGKVSKTEIKRETRYSMETILLTIDELISENLIFYAEKGNSKNGRKPTYISLNPKGGYLIGLTFHAAEINCCLLDYCGTVLDFLSEPLEKNHLSVDYVLKRLAANLKDLLERQSSIRKKILGIGVGIPGYVDDNDGLSIFYPHIPNWNNIDVCSYLRQIVSEIPIYAEHNTNGMALAYKWLCPAYKGLCYLVVSIRSGVRMSCVFDNSLYKGKNSAAGEIGHIRVEGGNRYCPCGKTGCLDTEVSESAIQERILEGVRVGRFHNLWQQANQQAENVNTDLFIACARENDPDCLALLDELCTYLGEALVRLLNTLNPDKIILSTKLNRLGASFYDRLNQIIQNQAFFVTLENFTLEATQFGDSLAAIGAACIVMEKTLSYVDAII